MEKNSNTLIQPCSKRWSKQDKDALQEVRKRLGNKLHGSPFPEVVGDRRILRFIKGKRYDLDKAMEMLSKHLEWRKANNVDNIRQDIVYGGKNTPLLFPNGDSILSARDEIVVTGLARDLKGRPLCFESYDFIPKEVLKTTNVNQFLEYLIYALEYRTLVMEQISHEYEQEYLKKHPNPEEREEGYGVIILNCTIRDLKGVGLAHLTQEGRTILTSALNLGLPNYEEFLGKGIFVNTPWLFKKLWYIISKFLDDDILAKLSFEGTDFMDSLKRDLTYENIPAHIGGGFTSYNEAYTFDTRKGGPLLFSEEQWTERYGTSPLPQEALPPINELSKLALADDTNIVQKGEKEGIEGREEKEVNSAETNTANESSNTDNANSDNY